MNALEGAALARVRAQDSATTQAWQTAMFALNGYGGKLKGKTLADYLIGDGAKKRRSTLADAQAFFNVLAAQGVPIKCYRTPAKPRGELPRQ